MNYNVGVVCNACGSWHRVRIQAGYLSKYPVQFYCGKCGSPIRGTIRHFPEKHIVRFELEVGAPATEKKFDPSGGTIPGAYLVECSGELLTNKMEFQPTGDLGTLVRSNPFFNAMFIFGPEKLSAYTREIVTALEFYSCSWPSRESAIRLLLGNRKVEAESVLGITLNEQSSIEAAHNLTKESLPVLIDGETLCRADAARRHVRALDRVQLSKMALFYEDHDLEIPLMTKSCMRLFSNFARRFSSFIPGFTYLASEKGYDLSRYGSYLCCVEDLRGIYGDCFELLGDFSRILIGMDNIACRGQYDLMAEDAPAKSFEKLLTGAPKGKILNQAESGAYTSLIGKCCWNANLRNAFDHNSYDVESKSQEIRIINNDGSIDHEQDIYVVEMVCQCIGMLRSLYVMEAVAVEVGGLTGATE
ncbi:hypothetical protein [uncultured Slackia sp.]|uniref:hypothetical protein n=1 Tax=uncultured Slackia sp. TaxID=665903 RepID=UPI0025F5E26C|nr:hypothetical protein [uncultured Slackia sp.]